MLFNFPSNSVPVGSSDNPMAILFRHSVGSHLADRLLADGHRVTVLDDLSTGSYHNIEHLLDRSDFEFVLGSILNADLVDDVIARSDVVFHLAAAVGVNLIVDQPLESLMTNVRGSQVVMEKAAQRTADDLWHGPTDPVFLLCEQLCGRPEEVTIEELAHRVIARTDSESKIRYVPYEEAYEEGFEDMERRVPDTTRAHALGAAGFVGYHVAARLTAEGDEVVGVDNSTTTTTPAQEDGDHRQVGHRLGRERVDEVGLMVGDGAGEMEVSAARRAGHATTVQLPGGPGDVGAALDLLDS